MTFETDFPQRGGDLSTDTPANHFSRQQHATPEGRTGDSPKESEAIAIVGLAFRFPGDLSDEHRLWNALCEKRDLVSRIPADRWAVNDLEHPRRNEPGRSITFSAGVLSGVDQFDAEFFGISPREAAVLDPQQRLLLELSWEAMEDAGVPPTVLRGKNGAVVVGISGIDYGARMIDDLPSMSANSMTGNTLSIAANRLSYVFDLHGPSIAVDTACSSSLAAIHLACNALRAGESSFALVGGVNLLLHPYPFVGFTKASMLSANGRCRVFDAAGDGYVRAEGGAVLLLKPLSNALAERDRIHAVILASGINADGARKTGLTVPSADGQAELMRSVLARSGKTPDDLAFFEAHGTGTPVGDPIEAEAISRVYGVGRDQPLLIGSVKANLGHLESASGMAGLIKAILALKHHALPPALHLTQPNPHINFAKLNLELVTEQRRLVSAADKPLVAGVNNFGFGGANAHLLLQEPPRVAMTDLEHEVKCPPPAPLFLSAGTPAALRALAQRYAERVESLSLAELYDVCYAAAYRRARLGHRLAVGADSAVQLATQLSTFAQGESADRVIVEEALSTAGDMAFIYSGNGAQWQGMARRLIRESPRFDELMRELDLQLHANAGFSVMAELQASEADSRIAETEIAQPLLFAIQVALTQLLRERGIVPVAVAGHSVGEVAAAWAAGILNLEQAIHLICTRSQAQGTTRGTGRMAVVGASAEALEPLLGQPEFAGQVVIAGFNSPDNVTVSGPLPLLERLHTHLSAQRIVFRLLELDYGFHSALMDPVRPLLCERLTGLSPVASSSVAFVSTVTGGVLNGSELGPDYWWKNIREPVRFASAVQHLAQLGCRLFVEIGPHAILQRYLTTTLSTAQQPARVLPTLTKDKDGIEGLEETVLRLQLLMKVPVLGNYFPVPGRPVTLPAYPWQRERFWHAVSTESAGTIYCQRIHPLLGWRTDDTEYTWENALDLALLPWLADHRLGDAIVFPAAGFVEMALAAAGEWTGSEQVQLDDFDIVAPLVLEQERSYSLRLTLNPGDGRFQILGRRRLTKDSWTVHAAGQLAAATPHALCHAASREGDWAKAVTVDSAEHYRRASLVGLHYGPAFQCLGHARVLGEWIDASVNAGALPESNDRFLMHPAVLDAGYQSLINFFAEALITDQGQALLPVRVGRMVMIRRASVVSLQARLRRRSQRALVADLELLDEQGDLVARLTDCRFRAAPSLVPSKKPPSSWRVVPHLKPHPADARYASIRPSFIPDAVLAAGFTRGRQRSLWFDELLPMTEALTLAFVYEAFEAVAHRYPDRWELLRQSEDSFIQWLASLLIQESLLRIVDGEWILADRGSLPSAASIWQTLLRDEPACLPQLSLIGQAGRKLPAVLAGETTPEQVQHQLLQSSAWDTLFDDDPAYLGTRMALEHLLHSLANDLPEGTRLRVLEIVDAPTALADALRTLPLADRIDYVIASADTRSEKKYSTGDPETLHVTVEAFDTDAWSPVNGQDWLARFDVILVRHVLHRAPVSTLALARMHSWLVSGGLLTIAERNPDWSAHLIFGLMPGWWREGYKSDDPSTTFSPIPCLRDPQAWRTELQVAGWDAIHVLTEPESLQRTAGAYLISSRARHLLSEESIPTIATWWLMADEASLRLAQALLRQLESQHQQVKLFTSAEMTSCDATHVIFLRGWQAQADRAEQSLAELLQVTQVMASARGASPRLWLLTQGGALATDLPDTVTPNPSQAALWGFVRTIMNEYPDLACKLIDLRVSSTTPAESLASRLLNELLSPDSAEEIILDAHSRYSLILQEDVQRASRRTDDETPFRLDMRTPGQLRELAWQPMTPQEPAAQEVEIRVRATGLNFRDVMYTMGLLPEEAVEDGFAGPTLGLECAGIVTRVGAAVDHLRVGDAVMGFGRACFASHVITRAEAVTRLPDAWRAESAATVPSVFLTVYYALKFLANVQPGERVLIHGAAGGVGMAALQMAAYMGAEIFATAGSEEKRDIVALLGAHHVFSSRDLGFADHIREATGGAGVDVVLNSLSGDAMRRSLSVLKPFGRFLELGKRDFFENTRVGLRPFKDNISYFGIDADRLLIHRPETALSLFRDVVALMEQGVLTPLPMRCFPADRVVDAFRTMQQSQHMGKLVISMSSAPTVQPPSRPKTTLQFESDATWLVTGGFDGFGQASVRWLVSRGMRHLILVSRRGMATPGAEAFVAQLQAAGVRTLAFACDVTEAGPVAEVIAEASKRLPPLKGVLHAAAVFDDGLIAGLSSARLGKVVGPKLRGAWNLHEATLGIPLDYFVLYSSVTTCLGSPGQANYVAANAGLEGLAEMRRHMGLPATCISWGPVGDSGYLARESAVRDSLQKKLGRPPMSGEEALNQLDQVLAHQSAQLTIAEFDWSVTSRMLPSASAARFARLNQVTGGRGAENEHADIRSLLATRPRAECITLVCQLVTQELADILRTSPERITRHRPLHELGMDSLMAVELALGLERRFGIRLPVMLISESPTAERVTERILDVLLQDERQADDQASSASAIVTELAHQHGESLSEGDLAFLASSSTAEHGVRMTA